VRKSCQHIPPVALVVAYVFWRVARHYAKDNPAIVTAAQIVLVVVAVGWLVTAVAGWLARRPGPGLGIPTTPEQWQELAQNWEQQRQERAAERQRRKQARKVADRAFMCDELPGAPDEKRSAQTDEGRLGRAGLPVLRSERELADWLGVGLPRLRWFTHHKPVDSVSHYVRYTIPKRNGGRRTILAPKTELKRLQRKVLHGILDLIPASEASHGFVKERSIATNAGMHVGRQVVLNIDLTDFFPTITYPRVRGLFMAFGYSFPVASTLALLCSECEREPFDRGQERLYVSVGPRALVQGAPTSPAIANLVAWRLDHRLVGLASKHEFGYTRYADDLTFSGDGIDGALRILSAAGRVIADEGFQINRDKTRVYRRSSKQMVTGLVVNDQVSTPRELRRRLRAIIHNAAKAGLQSQNRDSRPDFRAHLLGQIAFVNEACPEHARRLKEDLASVPD